MSEPAVGGVEGYAPSVHIGPAVNPEKEKYQQMWQREEYRRYAPGEAMVGEFLKHVSPPKTAEIIDFGAGTGRGALLMAAMTGCRVTMLDFTDNSLDPEVAQATETQGDKFNFIQHDLTKPIPVSAPYGYCTDVMEHIPTEDVDQVLNNILSAANRVFFQISLEDDACGKLIGESLHLTVKPFNWWMKKFRERGVDIMFSRQQGQNAIFYVCGSMEASEFTKTGKINTDLDTLVSNITANVERRIRQAEPFPRNNTEVMLLGGGPSLAKFTEEIREKREEGMPVICTNGTYNWCLDNDIVPSAFVAVDARPFMTRFVRETVPTCKYFIASQCCPAMMDTIPEDQLWMWHSVASDYATDILENLYGEELWYPVGGGSTVMLRALVLFRMLGFHKFHVYGFDSCVEDDKHHAYDQEENDGELVVNVTAGDRTFKCQPWMAQQAEEFQKQATMMQDEVSLVVYGDGLIAHMVQTAANLATEA